MIYGGIRELGRSRRLAVSDMAVKNRPPGEGWEMNTTRRLRKWKDAKGRGGKCQVEIGSFVEWWPKFAYGDPFWLYCKFTPIFDV